MTELEKAVMNMLLEGDEYTLGALREQPRQASVVNRTFSGTRDREALRRKVST